MSRPPHRHWTFEPPRFNRDADGTRDPWRKRLKGRWVFVDAWTADAESLDDGPRPSDLNGENE